MTSKLDTSCNSDRPSRKQPSQRPGLIVRRLWFALTACLIAVAMVSVYADPRELAASPKVGVAWPGSQEPARQAGRAATLDKSTGSSLAAVEDRETAAPLPEPEPDPYAGLHQKKAELTEDLARLREVLDRAERSIEADRERLAVLQSRARELGVFPPESPAGGEFPSNP